MQAEINLVLKLSDKDTENDSQVTIRIYRDADPTFIWLQAVKALNTAMVNMGFLPKEGDKMTTMEEKMKAELQRLADLRKSSEMTQDLTHHKTEETDTLVKAENPADDFMRTKELDRDTHGKLK